MLMPFCMPARLTDKDDSRAERERKTMKDKIFGVLQRIGRSFMLPIAVLPVAGLLLGIGSSFTNETMIASYGLQGILGDGTVLHGLLTVMSKAGSAIFDNLPLIFAAGVAIGMAKKEKEVAALSAVIAFFVMHVSINAMLTIDGQILADGSIAPDVLSGTIASMCLAASSSVLAFPRCTIAFTRSNCRTRCPSLAVAGSCRSFPRSSSSLSAS